MRYTVGNHKGQLCLVTEWYRQQSEPIEDRQYYPTGLLFEPFAEYEGKEVAQCGTSAYYIGSGFNQVEVRLVNGGQTTAIHTETRPVKRPKWGAAYFNGEWKRYEPLANNS